MTTPNQDAWTTFWETVHAQGWDDSSILNMLIDFTEQQGSGAALATFARNVAAAESGGNPISLQVFGPQNQEQDHFLLTFARPGRVEISVSAAGKVLAHVYDGAEVDTEQPVLFAYDANVSDNEDVSA